MVLRVHDGGAGALDTVKADGALTFTTDKFSTCAIVKLAPEEEADGTEETPDPTETEGPDVTPEPAGTDGPAETEEPAGSDGSSEDGTNSDASGEQTGSDSCSSGSGSGSSGSSSGEATSPQTGDAGNLVLWIVLFALCGAALIGTSIAVKRRDNG